MQFTRYIPSPMNGVTVDPLGLLRPAAGHADLLFRNFTVLSNHPGYLGFLCFAFAHLQEERNLAVRDPRFSIAFREIEVLWGLICLDAEDKTEESGPSILNVNRLRKVNREDKFVLNPKNDPHGLFLRLGYGTLGHYHGPAVLWGLIDKQYGALTENGRRIATAWSERGPREFAELSRRWRQGAIHDFSFVDDFVSYSLNAPAGADEKEQWRERIADACDREPTIAPLWQSPPNDVLLSLPRGEDTYKTFFPSLAEAYERNEELKDRLLLCCSFEMIAAVAQLVFEWEYLKKAYPEKCIPDVASWTTCVVDALRLHIPKYLELRSKIGVASPWRLADEMGAGKNYEEVAACVLRAHRNNQNRKGALLFMDGERVLVQNRYPYDLLSGFMDGTAPSAGSVLDAAAWLYRRNWYFHTARIWLEYAGMRHD